MRLRCAQAEAAYRAALRGLGDSGAEDQQQSVAGRLARLLVRQRQYSEAIEVLEPALLRSDAALMDARRSRDGAMQAVERVGDLYGLLSLCQLRQAAPDPLTALIAADSGRARLLTEALALDAVRLVEINDPDIRHRITEAWDRRTSLSYQLNHRPGSGTGIAETQPTVTVLAEAREQLQAALREATDAYVSLCRLHGLIRTPKPLSFAEIVAAVPQGGALGLPVLTETGDLRLCHH